MAATVRNWRSLLAALLLMVLMGTTIMQMIVSTRHPAPSSHSRMRRKSWPDPTRGAALHEGIREALKVLDAAKSQYATFYSGFDVTRCMKATQFALYVYPRTTDESGDTRFDRSLDYLNASEFSTRDASQACLLFPFVNTVYDVHHRMGINVDSLHGLHGHGAWNHGRNHLLYNDWDNKNRFYSEPLEMGMRAHPSAVVGPFRVGMDVHANWGAPPRVYLGTERCAHNRIQRKWTLDARGKLEENKYLLAFKGTRYLRPTPRHQHELLSHNTRIRNDLSDWWLEKDRSSFKGVYLSKCHSGDFGAPGTPEFVKHKCGLSELLYDKYEYHDLLENTLFGLCPKGVGAHANRLYEYFKCATLPVVLSDNHVQPFEHDLLDYSGLVLHLPEKDIWRMHYFFDDLNRLMDAHPQLLATMRKNLHLVWHQYFDTRFTQIDHTVRAILTRISFYAPHLHKPGGQSLDKSFRLNRNIDRNAWEDRTLRECGDGDGFLDCEPRYQPLPVHTRR